MKLSDDIPVHYFQDLATLLEESSENQTDKRVPWTVVEDIILHGVIFDCRLQRGAEAGWDHIEERYKLAKDRFCSIIKRQMLPTELQNVSLSCLQVCSRSVGSLKKRYGTFYTQSSTTEFLGLCWPEIYSKYWCSVLFNKNYKLLSPNEM